MTKVEVLRQIAANLSGKESRGETIVDCLKEIILSLDADADISECNTIVDCLNAINKIKGSTKAFQTKTDCLKELILTQDSTAKVNNLVTISDCLSGLATVLGSTDSKNGTVAEKLLALKEIVKAEEECQHTTQSTRVKGDSEYCNYIEVRCTKCNKLISKTGTTKHEMIDYGNPKDNTQPTMCKYLCGYVSSRPIVQECQHTNTTTTTSADGMTETTKCSECDAIISTHTHTTTTSRAARDDTYCYYNETKCSECGKVFSREAGPVHNMVDFGEAEGNVQPTRCSNRCGYTSTRLIEQECTHSNTTTIESADGLTETVKCTDCETVISTHTHTPKAKTVAGDETYCNYKEYRCTDCDKLISREGTTEHHMVDNGDPVDNTQPTICDICYGYESSRPIEQECEHISKDVESADGMTITTVCEKCGETLSEHTHTPKEVRANGDDTYCYYTENKCSDSSCNKLFGTPTPGPIHEMIDYGSPNGNEQPTICSKCYNYTSSRTIEEESETTE